MPDNEIEDTIEGFEWWIDLLDEDPTPSAQHDFSEFCYVNLPALLAEIKMLRKFIDLNHLEKMYRIYREQRLEADNETHNGRDPRRSSRR